MQINRLRRWAREGLLCIGDCAHAMSPAVGVGINPALQDAAAARESSHREQPMDILCKVCPQATRDLSRWPTSRRCKDAGNFQCVLCGGSRSWFTAASMGEHTAAATRFRSSRDCSRCSQSCLPFRTADWSRPAPCAHLIDSKLKTTNLPKRFPYGVMDGSPTPVPKAV